MNTGDRNRGGNFGGRGIGGGSVAPRRTRVQQQSGGNSGSNSSSGNVNVIASNSGRGSTNLTTTAGARVGGRGIAGDGFGGGGGVGGGGRLSSSGNVASGGSSAQSSQPSASSSSSLASSLPSSSQQRPVVVGAAIVGIPRKAIDDFSRQYQLLVYDASVAERSASDIRRIADANFAVYKLISSFLEAIRAYAVAASAGVVGEDSSSSSSISGSNTGSTGGSGGSGGIRRRVMVSVHDLDTLESERELRLLRSIVARNAESMGLGDTFLASLDPQVLKRDLTNILSDIGNKKGGGGAGSGIENDDSTEEQRPETVNLDDNGGLYSIRSTADALPIDQLVGYETEVRELVSFCRRVDFVNTSISSTIVSTGETGGSGNNSRTAAATSGGGSSGDGVSASARNPTVVMLYGPPGTGKTTVAQSVAKYLNFVYMYVNAENVTSQWAGGTEKNIAKIFRRARIASARCSLDPSTPRRVLILIDEIDGLIKNRATAGGNLTGEEYSRITTFLQMLTPPLGTNNSNLVVVCTTNRLENIDAAVVNRARGRIFMGYVVSPTDRYDLVLRVFHEYVRDLPETAIGDGQSQRYIRLQETVIRNDDLVPRDLQNILAQVKNRIIERYAVENGISGGGGGGNSNSSGTTAGRDLRIDLANPANRISIEELIELLNVASPATPVTSLLRDYSPPLSFICRWLFANDPYIQFTRSGSTFVQFRDQCSSNSGTLA